MKRQLLLLLLVLLIKTAFAGSPVRQLNGINNTTTINTLDTVVFDLSQAVITGNNIQFPVSILSDDTIYALDFSFKYDHAKLIYDSVIDLTNYMQSLAYYNTSDSTVRFTSNSFQQYTNDTALVKISFDILSGAFNATDLSTIKVLLNGGQCTVKVINVSSVGLFNPIRENDFAKVYPNPATEHFTILASEKATIELFNSEGKIVYENNELFPEQKLELNSSNFLNGIYLLKVYNEKNSSTQKLVINN